MFLSISSIDQSILLPVYHVAASSPVFSWVAIFLAQWLAYIAIGFVVVYVLFVEEDEKQIFRSLLTLALPVFLAWVVVLLLKLGIHAPRPFVGDLGIVPLVSVLDPFGSFPSAHATVFGALFGAMYVTKFQFWRWYGAISLLVAFGRVATGVHWPSDVFAGLVWGVFVGFWGAKILMRRK